MNFYSHPMKGGGYRAINLDKVRTIVIHENTGMWRLEFWFNREDYLSRDFGTKEEALGVLNEILSL